MEYYEIGHFTERELERLDFRGNNPLHLAAKLSKKDEDYLPIVSYLLKIGSNFKAKDGNGWTVIDESITNLNIRLLSLIFDH